MFQKHGGRIIAGRDVTSLRLLSMVESVFDVHYQSSLLLGCLTDPPSELGNLPSKLTLYYLWFVVQPADLLFDLLLLIASASAAPPRGLARLHRSVSTAAELPACIRFSPLASAFSCCSQLLPDCVRFACCSPIASALTLLLMASDSSAAPRLRPLQLLLPGRRWRPLRLLLPASCSRRFQPCPLFSNILRRVRGSLIKLKYEGRASLYSYSLLGVVGNLAPPRIWHPHAKFPRDIGTPSGILAPPMQQGISRGGHSHRLYSHSCDRSRSMVNGQSRPNGCSQRSKRVKSTVKNARRPIYGDVQASISRANS